MCPGVKFPLGVKLALKKLTSGHLGGKENIFNMSKNVKPWSLKNLETLKNLFSSTIQVSTAG
jgi:hypothetical protein